MLSFLREVYFDSMHFVFNCHPLIWNGLCFAAASGCGPKDCRYVRFKGRQETLTSLQEAIHTAPAFSHTENGFVWLGKVLVHINPQLFILNMSWLWVIHSVTVWIWRTCVPIYRAECECKHLFKNVCYQVLSHFKYKGKRKGEMTVIRIDLFYLLVDDGSLLVALSQLPTWKPAGCIKD